MLAALLAILQGAVSTLRSHRDLLAEIAALRQQLAIYKRTVPRPKIRAADRVFWVTLRRLWSGWRGALVIVKPETVISWQRRLFRRYGSWISRRRRSANWSAAWPWTTW